MYVMLMYSIQKPVNFISLAEVDFSSVSFAGQTVGPRGFDINVAPVWRKNITGRGVVVTILDDGIEYTHPDLQNNYESRASWDFNNHDNDPLPRYSKDNINKHGTRYPDYHVNSPVFSIFFFCYSVSLGCSG